MDGFITIGEGAAINSFAKIFGHGGVTVGDFAQIGPGALLTTTTHDMEHKMQASFHPIRIGNWSWIGANAIVLSGITIGEHCIIGAGSMVTKDIPSYSVAVGSPAKVIKNLTIKIHKQSTSLISNNWKKGEIMERKYDLSAKIEPFDSFWEAPEDMSSGYDKFGKILRPQLLASRACR